MAIVHHQLLFRLASLKRFFLHKSHFHVAACVWWECESMLSVTFRSMIASVQHIAVEQEAIS